MFGHAAAILLAVALTSVTPPALVLRSGDVITLSGRIDVSGDTVIFRSNGTLYSIASDEIDFDATDEYAERLRRPRPDPEPKSRLKVSPEERDRLLRELEKAKPSLAALATRPSLQPPPAQTVPEYTPPTPSREERDEERYWRQRSLAEKENVLQREEDLAYLTQKEQRLEDNILGLMSVGYKPHEFSYQVLQLERTREQLERARLEVERAQRQHDQFREEARREGVLPGWLR